MSNYIYKTGFPPAEQFAFLFETTGWNANYQLSLDELALALTNSWLGISVYSQDRLVGFGRVVTDEVMHAMIYDLIVHPEYQNQGIGSQILEILVQACLDAGIKDIQLFCANGKTSFYEKRGFVRRAEDAPGMQFQRVKASE